MFIKSDNLDKSGLAHGFFGRRGGVSGGIYESLNCGFGTDDAPENAAQNRAKVCEALGVVPENLLNLYQIHSDKCVTVTEGWAPEGRPEADAMVTDRAGLALGILTADCAPVLFYGEKADGAPVIGAAHAGWGGAVKGVLESTVAAMEALGAGKDTMTAAIGPCIMQGSYEVSDAFQEPFMAQDQANAQFFREGKDGHLQFDLPGYIVRRLMLLGVPEIMTNGIDTYFDELDYFSFRRTTHRAEPDYGRQISVISIKE